MNCQPDSGFFVHVLSDGYGCSELDSKMLMWRIMEDLQDGQPHLWFGWYGFIPMVYFS